MGNKIVARIKREVVIASRDVTDPRKTDEVAIADILCVDANGYYIRRIYANGYPERKIPISEKSAIEILKIALKNTHEGLKAIKERKPTPIVIHDDNALDDEWHRDWTLRGYIDAIQPIPKEE